eukprot:6203946-Pleurochrysis_carterae.AAC.4
MRELGAWRTTTCPDEFEAALVGEIASGRSALYSCRDIHGRRYSTWMKPLMALRSFIYLKKKLKGDTPAPYCTPDARYPRPDRPLPCCAIPAASGDEMAERLLPTKAASSTAEPAEKEERVENRAQDNSPEAASEVDLEAAIVTSTASQSQPQEPCSARAECVICLGDLDGEGERTLSCNHTFHSGCITEWLEANGKCPVCRRVIDEAVVARAADRDRERSVAGVLLDPRIARVLRASVDAVESTQTMHAESRRLMMFATMQAALSVLVTDVLSPPLMLLSATMIFIGASNFSLRAIAMCRPVLCMNVMYHLFLVTRMVHQTEGDSRQDGDLFPPRLAARACLFPPRLAARAHAFSRQDLLYAPVSFPAKTCTRARLFPPNLAASARLSPPRLLPHA